MSDTVRKTKKTAADVDAQKIRDNVWHPPHYTSHPSGVECIQVAEHFNFNLGNAIKYIWRAGQKGKKKEDLLKARQYIDFELAKMEREVK